MSESDAIQEGNESATNENGVESGQIIEKDELFDPTAEMLVNAFDDERTLDEEESIAAIEAEDPDVELLDLQKESDMPIEELLAMYGYKNKATNPSNEDENAAEEEPDEKMSGDDENESSDMICDNYWERKRTHIVPSKLSQLYNRSLNSENDHELLFEDGENEGEEEEHGISSDEEDLKKKIMIGVEFQANIPEGLSNYDDALPYENEDKLLWDPNPMQDEAVDNFLKMAKTLSSKTSGKPGANQHVRCDEQALYLLLQCAYNHEEALRRMKINTIATEDAMSLWSEEECQNFEGGLKMFGKDFHQIQQKKVRTRSVGELVQFYYLWKKTERHDAFSTKEQLEKKKYSVHTTDFMDKFLDDQGSSNGRDQSSSPTNFSIFNDKKSNFRYLNQTKFKPKLNKFGDMVKRI